MLAFANADAESKVRLRARPDVYVCWLTSVSLRIAQGVPVDVPVHVHT